MKNKYIFNDDDTVIIFANGGGKKDNMIIIDADKLELVDNAITGSWYISLCKGTVYAKFCVQKKGEKRKYLLMHRLIMNCPADMVVDHHPNHYGLDNRVVNLNIVTAEENLRNRQGSVYYNELINNAEEQEKQKVYTKRY